MARAGFRKKLNAKGRNTEPTDRFVRLGYRILNSSAYSSLTPNARALLVEMLMLYNGENNGSIYLSVRDATARLGYSDTRAVQHAFDELEGRGFITLARDAHFSVKAGDHSRARTWILNWLAGPGRRVANWEFLDGQPEPQTDARKRMERRLRALKRYRKDVDCGKYPVMGTTTLVPFGSLSEMKR